MKDLNSEYFSKIYAETKHTIYACVYSKAQNKDDAADIFQETYMELVKVMKRRGESYIENPIAFLKTVALKKVSDYYRNSGKIQRLSLNDAAGEDAEVGDFIEAGINVEADAVSRETVREIYSVLAEKDTDTKRIFELYYRGDMKIAQIASELQISQTQVKNKLYRTLKDLRKIYT